MTVYSGGPGGTPKNLEQSFDLPVLVQAAPAGTNVKLWIFNPQNKKLKPDHQAFMFRFRVGNGNFIQQIVMVVSTRT